MKIYPIRLTPGFDVKAELDRLVREEGWKAACVVSAVGSLTVVPVRFANAEEPEWLRGHFEIVSLSGTLSPDGSHLHISVADGAGKMTGGHLMAGSEVYTTAEIVIGVLEEWEFSRELDERTGYEELAVQSLRFDR